MVRSGSSEHGGGYSVTHDCHVQSERVASLFNPPASMLTDMVLCDTCCHAERVTRGISGPPTCTSMRCSLVREYQSITDSIPSLSPPPLTRIVKAAWTSTVAKGLVAVCCIHDVNPVVNVICDPPRVSDGAVFDVHATEIEEDGPI